MAPLEQFRAVLPANLDCCPKVAKIGYVRPPSCDARPNALTMICYLFQNANILSAVLCLIKELDYGSLEVVDTTIHCRMAEMED